MSGSQCNVQGRPDRMRRREFVMSASFAAAMWPLATPSQEPNRVHHLAVLLNGAPDDAGAKPRLEAFLEALGDLGWIEGKNLRVDVRWGRSDPGLIRENAVELLKLKPDAVLAATSTVVAAVKNETTNMPVVFVVVSDPEGQGFVRTVAHPGGNITGFTALEYFIRSQVVTAAKRVRVRRNARLGGLQPQDDGNSSQLLARTASCDWVEPWHHGS